ncbi:MAG: tRNA uridine-5-carboxymethylaminomethyl(34) synthesis GTPase MnmE [Eubacteriales bacterium]|nr:tRNA uridine-5-carboxymethylaminomethyl(34) synthesis GTPase MnmE [Eubacteriales bacterium]
MEATIAAVATALGNGSISIIRVSGTDAVSIVNGIFDGVDLTTVPTHTIHYGHIREGDTIIDEVMVTVMRAPRTYTREDVVEINGHGGILVTKRVLQALFDAGVREAEPGEFTKRAFLNGRIDLAQAESVMDLIQAKNQMAITNSLNQLSGRTTEKIRVLREKILSEIAYIEAALDDPEYYEMSSYGERIREDIAAIEARLAAMIRQAENGEMMRDGITTAIVGLPNAGKSSLLNYLANRERAIVTDIAGTTRDTIEERILMDDIVLNMVDTAGIRDTTDAVERIGVRRSLESIERAQLILYVIDTSVPLTPDNDIIFDAIGDKKTIILLNKTDCQNSEVVNELPSAFEHVIHTSLTEETGLEALKDCIREIVYEGSVEPDEDLYVANERQRRLLIAARDAVQRVLDTIDEGFAEDFLSIDLTEAYASLGKILGEEIEEDIINKIFKDFCMGK